MSIGEQIKELLHERNITQKQLAKDLHIPPTTLNGYVRDFREPDVETLKIIATYFDVTVDYLLGFNQTPMLINDKSLSASEIELFKNYRRLKSDNRKLLVEQSKLMVTLTDCKRP